MADIKIQSIGVGQSGRVPEIDALRGVGALAILSFHLWPGTFFFGWTRVDLFFVISGYLITSITFKYGYDRKFLIKFYLRRVLRTWPTYFALVSAICFIRLCRGADIDIEMIIYYFTFSQNIQYYWTSTPAFHDRLLVHAWCLFIEEQFYVIWPPLLLMFRGWKLAPLLIWVILNSVILRACGMHPWTLAARCDALAMGSLVAVVLHNREWVSSRLHLVRTASTTVSAIAAAGIVILYSPYMGVVTANQTFSEPLSALESLIVLLVGLFYAGLVTLIVCYTGRLALKPLRFGLIRYLGQASYGIFLYHLPIIELVGEWFPGSSVPVTLATFVACIIAGVVSWELFEKPLANLKRRLPYAVRPLRAGALNQQSATICKTVDIV